MKKSTVLFGTGEQLMDQTRSPRLIEKRITQNQQKAKKSITNKQGSRITIPKNRNNNFSK